jgi:hypothetical protein
MSKMFRLRKLLKINRNWTESLENKNRALRNISCEGGGQMEVV